MYNVGMGHQNLAYYFFSLIRVIHSEIASPKVRWFTCKFTLSNTEQLFGPNGLTRQAQHVVWSPSKHINGPSGLE